MNHFITLERAKKMTALYRKQKDNVVKPEFQEILLNSETFDAESFRSVLDKPGCSKLRIYFGMNDDLKIRLITVGVNADGTEMLDGDESILEEGVVCPPYCPPPPPPPSLNYE